MYPVETPFKVYTGLDGKPIDNGYVYFGVVDQNPITSPVTVYWDVAGTQPASQPLRTEKGYIIRAGTPANVFVSGNYSELVQDSRKRQVFFARDSSNFSFVASLLAFIALLASSIGASLIGFIQAGVGAVARTVQGKLRDGPITPQDFGAVGGGVTDDTDAFLAMFATGKPWYIPYVSGGYLISETLTISADGTCDGTLHPTVDIGGAANDYDKFTVVIASAGYTVKRVIRGLKVQGNTTLRAASVSGIRNDCENSTLENCYAPQLDFGIVIRSYSITLRKCNAAQCNTNISGYAPAANKEINALTIDGGNYDSPVDYSVNLGDQRWSDAIAVSISHGVCINMINGANFDGGEITIESCSTINITGVYSEASTTDVVVRLGGAGDGYIANVNIANNFFKNAKYVVKCQSAVKNLTVGPNFLSAITIAEVSLTSDIYGVTHRVGEYAGCFANGKPVGIAFRSLAVTALDFSAFTLGFDLIARGAYLSNVYPIKWYPGTIYQSLQTQSRNLISFTSKGVYYTTPSLTKAGTVASNVFTFTTKADSYAFNGGDAIVTAPAGAVYIRSVDWDAGTALMDGGVTANGAATISQVAPRVVSETYSNGAAPASGTWTQGDISHSYLPAVGSPKGWVCTVSGTPGTWVSRGNL